MQASAPRRTLISGSVAGLALLVIACAVLLWKVPRGPGSFNEMRPDVKDIFPSRGEVGVPVTANPVIDFNKDVAANSVNGSIFLLRDASGNTVSSTVAYDSASRRAILRPKAPLSTSSEYFVSVLGGSGGVRDRLGKTLAGNLTWSFTTAAPPPPPPTEGPGGPILLIAGAANPFSRYYAEILRNEGLNEFTVIDLERVTPDILAQYDTVILGELPLSFSKVELLTTWVRSGGHLIAIRPSAELARNLGLAPSEAKLKNGYLAIDTRAAPGAGLLAESIQFHGDADLYTLQKGRALATLYSTSSSATESPAITINQVGSGLAAVFAYDLARSVVYTRQGNPAWSGKERDGIPPIRSDDLFYGDAATDPEPDWVDFAKVAIPQADIQQRLLANLILLMNADRQPLPRIWYFPRGYKAVIVMTGDDHGHGGTGGRFRKFVADSKPGCSVENWECIRGTSNIYAHSIDPGEAAQWQAQGFEIGLHVFTNCYDWPLQTVIGPDGKSETRILRSGADALYAHQLRIFKETYPGLRPPATNRIDCVTWSDYDTQPQVELDNGIRFDEDYYYWPPKWVRNRPGLFTGSGMPMRFAKMDGSLIDVYQAATQITDETHQTIPATVETLLSNALGPKEFYGAFVVNMHTDKPDSPGADAIVASAQSRAVPVVTALQMLHWLDGRNASSFHDLTWAGNKLEFTLLVGAGANGLQVMLPYSGRFGTLKDVTIAGAAVPYRRQVRMGVEYACFEGRPGRYTATYASP